MLGFRINYKFLLPVKFGHNNNQHKGGENVKHSNEWSDWSGFIADACDHARHWITATPFVIAIVFLVAGCLGGCVSTKGDDTNCAVHCGPSTDAGPMADADHTQPDAMPNTTPDGNTNVCAAYAGVPSDGWLCSPDGSSFNYDMNGLTFVDDNGVCMLRSDFVWCQDTPPAADVQAAQFSCTDIGTQAHVTCWHN